MLAKFLRRYFGSIRLFMTLLVVLSGLTIVLLDVRRELHLSTQLYGFLSAMLGAVAVFVWKDTDRPSGFSPQGTPYFSDKDGDA